MTLGLSNEGCVGDVSGDGVPVKTDGGLRILHTSDWHIGKRLYHQTRYDEFAKFLAWLATTLDEHHVDVLIVAGDVFDTMTPSNRAQELYYDFLGKVARSACRHVIITAGNHDSPTFLEAPRQILRSLSVQVVGAVSDDVADELITLEHDGAPKAIIMAVPFLRDRDVRRSTGSDVVGQMEQHTARGIAEHYQALAQLAEQQQAKIRSEYDVHVPIIATGHLFAIGASASARDDGMRDLYVGTLGQVSADIFAPCIDYVALGHIHAMQKVGGQSRIRYSGAPLTLGFGELGKSKQVLIVDFEDTLTITPVIVPVFQRLARISGDWPTLKARLGELVAQGEPIWLDIIYTGDALEPQLVSKIHTITDGTPVIALNIQNKTLYQSSLKRAQVSDNLSTLSVSDVFARRLASENLPDDEQKALSELYHYVVNDLYAQDRQAE